MKKENPNIAPEKLLEEINVLKIKVLGLSSSFSSFQQWINGTYVEDIREIRKFSQKVNSMTQDISSNLHKLNKLKRICSEIKSNKAEIKQEIEKFLHLFSENSKNIKKNDIISSNSENSE